MFFKNEVWCAAVGLDPLEPANDDPPNPPRAVTAGAATGGAPGAPTPVMHDEPPARPAKPSRVARLPSSSSAPTTTVGHLMPADGWPIDEHDGDGELLDQALRRAQLAESRERGCQRRLTSVEVCTHRAMPSQNCSPTFQVGLTFTT